MGLEEKLKEVSGNWISDVKEMESKLHPEVRRLRERAKQEVNLTIWLGGPGEKDLLFYKRKRISEFLETQNFSVIISEEYPYASKPFLLFKEREEAIASDLVVIITINPGALAEAIEFGKDNCLRDKIVIFCPEEFTEGLSIVALRNTYTNVDLFSLEKYKECDSELDKKIYEVALQHRSYHYEVKKRRERLYNGYGK